MGDTVTDQHQATSSATDLAARIRGEVLTAGDLGYDAARTPHFAFRTGHPKAVIRPADAADVAAVVETAARTGVGLHVRGGGHHAAGHATGDGLLVDMSSLGDLDFAYRDESGFPTVWADAGLTAGEVTRILAERGLAVGFGDTGSVGIGGITLGGGIGFLSRRYGLTVDNLLGAEIVTADGRIRQADATHDPDLFWAIRGGGGNFGIATRFHYRTVPVSEVYGGVLFLVATPESIERLAAAAVAAADDLTIIASVMAMPPMEFVPADLHGQLVVMIRLCYAGDPARGEQAVAPLRLAGKVLADMVQPMPYPELFDEPPPSHGSVVAVHNTFLDRIDLDTAGNLLDHLHRSDAWLRMVQFRTMGGAINRVPSDATAFAHRDRQLMVTLACNAQPNLAEARDWVEALAADLPLHRPGGYIGFFGPHDGHRIADAYPPATLARLRRVKTRVDPNNLLRHNDNIIPDHPASAAPRRDGDESTSA
jgi:FAD/FMN-containing dehydrogenase